jgi:hypothetical protein
VKLRPIKSDTARINTRERALEVLPIFSQISSGFPAYFTAHFTALFPTGSDDLTARTGLIGHPPALRNPIMKGVCAEGEVAANAIRPDMKGLFHG